MNAATKVIPIGKAARSMNLRLSAPFLSAKCPIIGSVTASHMTEMRLTVEASAGFMCATSVRKRR